MRNRRTLLLVTTILVLASIAYAGSSAANTIFYAAESKGITCGYAEIQVSEVNLDGKVFQLQEEKVLFKIKALGVDMETKIEVTYHVDPETGQFFFYKGDIDQGTIQIGSTVVVDAAVAHVTERPSGDTFDVELPENTIFRNAYYFPFLKRDFLDGKIKEKTYDLFDVMDSKVQKVRFKSSGIKELIISGVDYKALVLDEVNLTTGAKMTWWIDSEKATLLKGVFPTRTLVLSNASVKGKIKTVDVDDSIFSKAGQSIADLMSISYMKVKAKLEPVGVWVTLEDLTVQGQTFTGTVQENLIEGVFEIRHERYDGANPPPFPPDYSSDPSLQAYLEPSDFIESDDPVLIEKARTITADAENSWEAMKLLSKWVAEEISYDIPGGGSARNTYDLKVGECGAHSNLMAAFCRAVGIPARVVWGCMYVPNRGGSFGQHGWNEIYMGETGWIPIDTTVREIDFADSGHIRLGILQSKSTRFGPLEMEILDFTAGSQSMGDEPVTDIPDVFRPFIGSYNGEKGKIFKVLVQNGHLALDIPDQMIFELAEPDEKGWRQFLLTDRVSISFDMKDDGTSEALKLYQLLKLPLKEHTEAGEEVPEIYRPYLGTYPVPMKGMDLTVLYQEGNLAVNDPQKGIVKLKDTDEKGMWIDEYDKHKISFARDNIGDVAAMLIHQVYTFPRMAEEEVSLP